MLVQIPPRKSPQKSKTSSNKKTNATVDQPQQNSNAGKPADRHWKEKVQPNNQGTKITGSRFEVLGQYMDKDANMGNFGKEIVDIEDLGAQNLVTIKEKEVLKDPSLERNITVQDIGMEIPLIKEDNTNQVIPTVDLGEDSFVLDHNLTKQDSVNTEDIDLTSHETVRLGSKDSVSFKER